MKKELLRIWISLKNIYFSTLGVKEEIDYEGTIKGIKRDISFRGHTGWILMFSILIASIGLNLNSTAVIIGAMLISPLMGPILGVGLSVGTNDIETLIKSLKNLALAVVISLITSTLFFILTPLDIAQSELLARTKPTFLDVLVALFGGFAGIVAGSKKEKTNVIPGVAIATALMPPLCTAGFGLANLRFDYFLGAFYLFFINSVFISLSTFLVVRYLKFPLVKIIEHANTKRYKLIFVVFLIITITPSTIIFYRLIQETRFNTNAERFISEKVNFDGSQLISTKLTYSDTLSVIDLFFLGKKINEEKQLFLTDMLTNYGLNKVKYFPITKKTVIKVHQEDGGSEEFEARMNQFNSEIRTKVLEDIYSKNEQIIQDKDIKIKLLEEQIMKLSMKDTIPYTQIFKELKFHFTAVEGYSFAKQTELINSNDTLSQQEVPTFLVRFSSDLSGKQKQADLTEIKDWLQVRLNDNSIQVLENK